MGTNKKSKLYSKTKPRKKAANIEKKRYLQKFCFFFPDLFLSRGFTKKNVYTKSKKCTKKSKNLLMYDKKNHLSPTPNNNKNNPKKTPSPNKKVRKEKKAEIPEKTKKEQPRKEKQTVKIKSQDYETFFCLSKTFCFTLLHIKINAPR